MLPKNLINTAGLTATPASDCFYSRSPTIPHHPPRLVPHRTHKPPAAQLLPSGATDPAKAAALKEAFLKLSALASQAQESESEWKMRVKDLNQEVQGTQTEVDNQVGDVLDDNTELGEGRRELMERGNEAETYRVRIADFEITAEQLRAEHSELANELEIMKDENSSSVDPEVITLKNTIAECSQEITQRKTEVEQLGVQIAERTQLYEEAEKEVVEVTADVEEKKTQLVVDSQKPQRIAKQAEHQYAHPIKSFRLQLDEGAARNEGLDADLSRILLLVDNGQQELADLDARCDRHDQLRKTQESREDKIRIALQGAKTEESDVQAGKVAMQSRIRLVTSQMKSSNEKRSRVMRERDSALKRLKRLEAKLAAGREGLELDTIKFKDLRTLNKAKVAEVNDLRIAAQTAAKEAEKASTSSKLFAVMNETETLNVKQKTHAVNEQDRVLSEHMKRVHDYERERRMMQRAVDHSSSEAMRSQSHAERVEEELMTAKNIVSDSVKSCDQLNKTRKELESLYQIMKNERNKYANQIVNANQRMGEMKEKVRILSNEMEILRSSALEREVRLSVHIQKFRVEERNSEKLRAQESQLRSKFGELRDLKKSINAENKQQLDQIDSHEARMNDTKAKLDRVTQEKCDFGERLFDRHEELCNFYEKVNVLSTILRNGEVQLQDRDEEIRFLRLEVKELHREIHLVQQAQPAKRTFQATLNEVLTDMQQTQHRVMELEGTLESCSGESNRNSRSVGAPEMSQQELDSKADAIAERLAAKEQKGLELDLVLLESQRLTQRVGSQVVSGKQETNLVARQVVDAQSKIKDSNRKLMALVSEVSMHQSNCIKSQQTAQQQSIAYENAVARYEQGLAPSAEAKKEWEREERKLLQAESERVMREMGITDEPPSDSRELLDGTITFAEIRPNAYLPDAAGALPKARPYGREAPFKPPGASSNLRFFKHPVGGD